MMVSACPYGLGNKVRSMMTCIALDREARACWRIDASEQGVVRSFGFDDLFAGSLGVSKHAIPPSSTIRRDHYLEPPPDDSQRELTWDLLNGGGFRQPEKRAALAPAVRALYASAAQRLVPRPRIRAMADEVLGRLGAAFSAVHVRTWSGAGMGRVSAGRQKAFRASGGLDLYCAKLDQVPRGERVFVASDSAEALAAMLSRYGPERIVTSPAQRWLGSGSFLECEWAVADMLVISQAATIVRSWESTFAEVAWWMGAARAREAVVKDHAGNAIDPIGLDLSALARGWKRRLLGR